MVDIKYLCFNKSSLCQLDFMEIIRLPQSYRQSGHPQWLVMLTHSKQWTVSVRLFGSEMWCVKENRLKISGELQQSACVQ